MKLNLRCLQKWPKARMLSLEIARKLLEINMRDGARTPHGDLFHEHHHTLRRTLVERCRMYSSLGVYRGQGADKVKKRSRLKQRIERLEVSCSGLEKPPVEKGGLKSPPLPRAYRALLIDGSEIEIKSNQYQPIFHSH